MFQKLKHNRFLLEELIKRDFKKKYKRSVLGMGWSVLSPLLMLLVMRLVFGELFGNKARDRKADARSSCFGAASD